MQKMTFKDLGVNDATIQALALHGIEEPTPVQQKVIPLIESGQNLLFQSETGTGKTLAYLLPLIKKLEKEPDAKNVSLLIAAPTYELASQIKTQIQAATEIKTALYTGGSPINRQIEALKEKPRIVVGGAGRILELIHLKKIKADKVDFLVLDETDRLLSKELRDLTKDLMERLSPKVQIIGCSATVNEYTVKILNQMRPQVSTADEKSALLLVSLPQEDVLRKRITHWALFAEKRDKTDTLRSFINAVHPQKMIVFTAKSDQVPLIAEKLRYKKIECEALSAKEDKKQRRAAVDRFKSGKVSVLVTTDLASRGLDIPGVSHVLQLDLPQDEDFFIHRAGRTARMGTTGINCVIGDERELRRYAALEKKLKITVYPKVLYRGSLQDPPKETE